MYPLGLSVPMISVKTAIPTPEKTKPAMAGRNCSPDKAPREGGKIKFPAPKNIPNRSKPVRAPFLAIIISFIFLKY